MTEEEGREQKAEAGGQNEEEGIAEYRLQITECRMARRRTASLAVSFHSQERHIGE
jgi:hypothetical protein